MKSKSVRAIRTGIRIENNRKRTEVEDAEEVVEVEDFLVVVALTEEVVVVASSSSSESQGVSSSSSSSVAPVAAMRASTSDWVVQAMLVPALLTSGSAEQLKRSLA